MMSLLRPSGIAGSWATSAMMMREESFALEDQAQGFSTVSSRAIPPEDLAAESTARSILHRDWSGVQSQGTRLLMEGDSYLITEAPRL